MAAGLGTRLRPLTDRHPKPVLPIDGRPVIVTLLRELAAADVGRVTVVTGHLAEQVERLLDGFDHDLRFVRQPEPIGSADALGRAAVDPPYLSVAADTVFAPGDVARFLAGAGDEGAIAVRRQPGRPDHTRIGVAGGLVVRVSDPGADGGLTAAPLTRISREVAAELEVVRQPPYTPPFELAQAFQRAIDAGRRIRAVEIGPTRDLTSPLDLVRENFPYLRGL